MVKDHRIKGHRLLARCCYGSCLGFGFVITTIIFAAMFWMIWCYFGLSFVQFSDSQRRSLVNYPPVTAKPPATFTTTSSTNIPEVSINQIPNSSTATSDVLRSDHSVITDKQKDLVHERSPIPPKRAFINNDHNYNKTRGRDAPKDRARDIQNSSSKPEIPETSTRIDDILAGKDDRSIPKSITEEGIIAATDVKNWKATKDDSYIDPDFIRENSRIPNRDKPVLPYDSRTKPDPNASRNEEESLLKDDRRDIASQSKNGQRAPSDSIYRDRIPVNRKSFDSDTDQRRSDDDYRDGDRRRDRVNKYDNTNPTEVRNRDRVTEEQFNSERKRISRQEDVYRGQDRDERYSEGRGRDNRDRYDERYRTRVPVDEGYNDRYQPRAPVDDKYDDRYRARVPADDKYYDDRYRSRVSVEEKYDDRHRADTMRGAAPIEDRYDERRRAEDRYENRYRDRGAADDRYIERYPDERRRGGDSVDYDDKRVREYRYRDRAVPDDRYSESERRKANDDKYEYSSGADERYRDEDRKKGDDSKYDTREDAYRSRDRFDEERIGSDRKREDNLQRSRPRDAYVDRYDNQETRRNRESIPSTRDTTDYSRTDDKRYANSPPPSERDLLSSRPEYEPHPVRTSPERREYSTRNERRSFVDDTSGRGQSGSYSTNYDSDTKRDGGSESRYDNGYRNHEYQGRSQYDDDRGRIAPTKVTDNRNFRSDTVDDEDGFRKKSINDDRRRDPPLGDSRSSSTVRNTNFETSDDHLKISTRIDGSKETGDARRRYDLKPSDEKRVIPSEEGAIDRRSYSSEDGFNGNQKSQTPADLRDRNYRPIHTETRDYRYEDSPSKYDDQVDEYRPSRRAGYESTDYPNRQGDSRNRDVRYDGERRSNVRDRDFDDDRYYRDRDVHRDSRRGSDEMPRRNREKTYEERYDEKYERYPSSDDEVQSSVARNGNSESRNRRYRPENDRDAFSSSGLTANQRDGISYSDDKPLMESRRDRNPIPLNSGNESPKRSVMSSSNNEQITPRAELIDGASRSKSSSYDPEQPMSAKDVIDTALRHSEVPGQLAKKVFYPVFDPRSSNLTSPDIIRPSERRGITVTAKRRRKR